MDALGSDHAGVASEPKQIRQLAQTSRGDAVPAEASDAADCDEILDLDDIRKQVKDRLLVSQYDVKDSYWKTGFWQAIARHQLFENTTLGVIAVNAISMWIDTDYNLSPTLLTAEWYFIVMENLFCVYFFFEWLTRFMAFERKCSGLKDNWFIFDSVLVFMMVGETWILTCIMLAMGSGSSSPLSNASILRLLRLARLSRMAKMLRSMPELLILCKGMVKASQSVVFVIILLFILLYVFAIAFVQMMKGTQSGKDYFDKIFPAIYTLLVTGTFLDGITDVTTNIQKDSLLCFYVFFLFVSLSALMVMNMLIGVLCEVISAVASTEKDDILLSFVTDRMKGVLNRIDEDGNGRISKDEFRLILKEKEAALALEAVGVDPVTLVEFTAQIFEEAEVADGDDEPSLDFPSFMQVVLRYRGSNQATIKDIIDHQKWVTSYVQSQLNTQAQDMQSLIARELHLRGYGDEPPPQSGGRRPSIANGTPTQPTATGLAQPTLDLPSMPVDLTRMQSLESTLVAEEVELIRRIQKMPDSKKQLVMRLFEEAEQDEDDSMSDAPIPGLLN